MKLGSWSSICALMAGAALLLGCGSGSGGGDCGSGGGGGADGCTPPDGMFACGSGFCAKGQQYCEWTSSDVSSLPDSYMCKSIPASCFEGGSPSCACFSGEPCGAMCKDTPDGDFWLTCPGG